MGKKRGSNSRRKFVIGIFVVAVLLLIFQFQNCSGGNQPTQIGPTPGSSGGTPDYCTVFPADPICTGGGSSPSPAASASPNPGDPTVVSGGCGLGNYQGLVFPGAYKFVMGGCYNGMCHFATQVQITNPNPTPLKIQASFWASKSANGTPTTSCITMDPGKTYTWSDFVNTIAGSQLSNVSWIGVPGLVLLAVAQDGTTQLPQANFTMYDTSTLAMGAPTAAVNMTTLGRTTMTVGQLVAGDGSPGATRSFLYTYNGCAAKANFKISASGQSGTGSQESHELFYFNPQNSGYNFICWGSSPKACIAPFRPPTYNGNLNFTVTQSGCGGGNMFAWGLDVRNSDNLVTVHMPQ